MLVICAVCSADPIAHTHTHSHTYTATPPTLLAQHKPYDDDDDFLISVAFLGLKTRRIFSILPSINHKRVFAAAPPLRPPVSRKSDFTPLLSRSLSLYRETDPFRMRTHLIFLQIFLGIVRLLCCVGFSIISFLLPQIRD